MHLPLIPRLAAAVVLLALAAPPVRAQPAAAQQPRDTLKKALPDSTERARTWLLAQQRADGSFVDWSEGNAVVALALFETGLAPRHPGFQKILALILKDTESRVEFLALRTELLARILPQTAQAARRPVESVIEKDLAVILASQEENGVWQHRIRRGPSQETTSHVFHALMLCTAEGFKIPDTHLKKAVAMYVAFQNSNGGWSHSTRGKDLEGANGPMTLRALTCLAAFGFDPCACREGSGKADEAVRSAVQSGLKFLQDNYRDWAKGTDERDEFFFRQCYHIGRLVRILPIESLGNAKLFDDWCLPLLARQERDGKWRGPLETAYVLYLWAQLAKPALICEMVNSDQPPVANPALVAAVEHLSLRGPILARYDRARLGLDYQRYETVPFIFLEVTEKFKLADEEKKNLRNYVARGGTVLVQLHCGKKEAADAAAREFQGVWPDVPAQPLLRNHPLWSTDTAITNRPVILGLDDGVRTFGFLFQKTMTCDLAGGDNATGQIAYQTVRNLVAYGLEGQLDFTRPLQPAVSAPAGPVKPGEGKMVSVGLLDPAARKAGAAVPPPLMPYDPWPDVVALITKGAAFRLLGPKAVACTDEHLPLCDIAWLSGSGALVLGDDEIAALKAYLAGGGFLVLEARLGDEAFDRAAKRIADGLGLRIEPGKDSPLLTGALEQGGQGFALERTSVRKGGRLLLAGDTDLRLLTLDGKVVGVCSPLDLLVSASGIRCWNLRGYAPAEARRLVANILLYRTVRK